MSIIGRRNMLALVGLGGLATATGTITQIPNSLAAPLAKGGVSGGRKRHLKTKFGDFRHRAFVDCLDLDLEHLRSTFMFRDLPFWTHWIWSVQYDAKGDCYPTVRGLGVNTAAPFMLQTNRGSDACHIAKESAQAYQGMMKIDPTKSGVLWRSMDYAVRPEPSMKVEISGSKFSWREGDFFELSGKLRPYMTQWYTPGAKSGEGEACVSIWIRTTGTILGERVDGWVGIDSMYMPAGETYHTSSMGHLESGPGTVIVWTQCANEYEDGTYENACLAAGLENWGLAAGIDNGVMWQGRCLRATFENNPQGFPRQIQVDVLNETLGREDKWVFTHAPRTDLVDLPALMADTASPYISCEGVWRRVGDTRKIKRSSGWPDYYPDDRHFKAFAKEFV